MLVCGVRRGSIGGQDSARNRSNEAVFHQFSIGFDIVCRLHSASVQRMHRLYYYTMQCTSHAHFQPKLHIRYQIRELIGEICVHGGGISISYLIVRAFFSLFAFLTTFLFIAFVCSV